MVNDFADPLGHAAVQYPGGGHCMGRGAPSPRADLVPLAALHHAVFGWNDGEGFLTVPNKKAAINDARRAYNDAEDRIAQVRIAQ